MGDIQQSSCTELRSAERMPGERLIDFPAHRTHPPGLDRSRDLMIGAGE